VPRVVSEAGEARTDRSKESKGQPAVKSFGAQKISITDGEWFPFLPSHQLGKCIQNVGSHLLQAEKYKEDNGVLPERTLR